MVNTNVGKVDCLFLKNDFNTIENDKNKIEVKGIPTHYYEYDDPNNPSKIVELHTVSEKRLFTRLMQTLSTNKILPFVKLDFVRAYDRDIDFFEFYYARVYTRTYRNSIVVEVWFVSDKDLGVPFMEFKTSENDIDVYFKMLQLGGIVKLLLEKKTISFPQGEMRLDCNVIEEAKCYIPINEKSGNIKVNGHIGTWHVIDTTQIYGAEYFLLRHDEFCDNANRIIVNKAGALIAEDIKKGFSDKNFKNEKAQQKRYFEKLQKVNEIVEEQKGD